MNLREAKSLEIAAKFRLIFDKGVWLVPSQSSSAVYRVSLAPDNSTCTCEDFNLRAEPCKHILAARLVQARDYGGKAPAIDTDVLPKKKTYKQNWPAYDEAQTTEKHRFQILLHDICRGLTEPSRPSKGRHGHTLRDTVFAAAFKVYTTFSSRRFSCDLLDAHTRGYVSRPIPGRKVNSFLEDEALTSVLHDLIVQSSLPLRTVETTFAPDSSGFSTSRFIRWYDEKYGHERSGRDWIKCHVLTGTKTNIVTAVRIEGRDAGHSPQFKPLLEKTAENFSNWSNRSAEPRTSRSRSTAWRGTVATCGRRCLASTSSSARNSWRGTTSGRRSRAPSAWSMRSSGTRSAARPTWR